MMIRNVSLRSKNFGTSVSAFLGLFVFMFMMSASTLSAQSYHQGQTAITMLKDQISNLQEKNCKVDVQGVPAQVAQKMNELRCEYHQSVLSGISEVFNAASVDTATRINRSHSQMSQKYPAASEALTRLKREVEDLLRK